MHCPCALPMITIRDYITCPLARLVRDVQGNWTQDEGYIPPLLAFNAHDGLVQRLDTLLLQLRAKCQRSMAMRRESNQRMADFAVADVSLFWLLNALNSVEPVLSDFPALPGGSSRTGLAGAGEVCCVRC